MNLEANPKFDTEFRVSIRLMRMREIVFGLPAFAFMMVACVFWVPDAAKPRSLNAVGLIACAVVFLAAWTLIIYRALFRPVLVTINERGLVGDGFLAPVGFVPWSSVRRVGASSFEIKPFPAQKLSLIHI